jgi:hypothetical protein
MNKSISPRTAYSPGLTTCDMAVAGQGQLLELSFVELCLTLNSKVAGQKAGGASRYNAVVAGTTPRLPVCLSCC